MTRYLVVSDTVPGRGRPLGFLWWWLGSIKEAKKDHCDIWHVSWVEREERIAAREALKLVPDGLTLLDCERPRREYLDEPEEPMGMP